MSSTDVREPRGACESVDFLGVGERDGSVGHQEVKEVEDPSLAGGGGDVANRQRPSRGEHAEGFGQGASRIPKVVERHQRDHSVESTVRERKTLRDCLHKTERRTGRPTALDLSGFGVEHDDLPGAFGEALGGDSGPSAQVENSDPGSGEQFLSQSTEQGCSASQREPLTERHPGHRADRLGRRHAHDGREDRTTPLRLERVLGPVAKPATDPDAPENPHDEKNRGDDDQGR